MLAAPSKQGISRRMQQVGKSDTTAEIGFTVQLAVPVCPI
jgi:hypothetical protein